MGLEGKRALLIMAAAAIIAACSTTATKGTMPPPGPNGLADPSSMPDFIAVAGNGPEIVGYARRQDVLGASDEPFPVYGDDLRTLVGQMIPGKGFVPIGVDPNTVPRIPVVVGPATQHPPDASKVVLYVRNDSSKTVYTALLIDGNVTGGGGFWAQNIGAWCDSMSIGAKLVVLDRSATDPDASVIRVLYTRGPEPEAPQLWVVASSVGTITQGIGAPAWWGTALAC